MKDEKAACVEDLPTGKRPRLDDSSSKGCVLAVSHDQDLHILRVYSNDIMTQLKDSARIIGA